MRRLLFAGSMTLVASAVALACSDDDPTPPGTTAGSGGTTAAGSGSGGSAVAGTGGSGNGGSGTSGSGMGGSSMGGSAGGGMGGSNMAGSAGSGMGGSDMGDPDAGVDDADAALADDAGSEPPCTGCVEIVQPFDAADTSGLYQVFLSASADMSDTVATFRVRVLGLNDQLYVQTFAQDSDFAPFSTGTFLSMSAGNFTDTETFIDIPLDISAINPQSPPDADAGADADAGGVPAEDFDASSVRVIGFQVGSGGGFTGSETARVVIDSITFSGSSGQPDLDFTSDAQGFELSTGFGLQTGEVIHHPE